MTIIHADNFSIYGANTAFMLNGIYAENVGCTLNVDPDGLSPGRVLCPGWDGLSNTNVNWRYAFQGGATPIAGAAFRMWNVTMPINNNLASKILQFRDNTNAVLMSFGVLSTGAIRLDINGHFHDTLIPVVTATGWYHVEIRFEHTGGTNVDFEVRIEGASVLSGSEAAAINADPAQAAAFHIQAPVGAQVYYLKDLVLWNGEGTQNNDFLGSVIVTNLLPASDVALNWSLVGGATGFGILDNIPPVDASYIYAEDVPLPAAYVASLTDLPTDVTSVKAVISYVRAAKSDGGDGSLQVGMISGVSTALGTDRPITVAQTYWRDVFELDPATAAPWLPSAVNASQLQINRTT